jgi:hypothetical protein
MTGGSSESSKSYGCPPKLSAAPNQFIFYSFGPSPGVTDIAGSAAHLSIAGSR